MAHFQSFVTTQSSFTTQVSPCIREAATQGQQLYTFCTHSHPSGFYLAQYLAQGHFDKLTNYPLSMIHIRLMNDNYCASQFFSTIKESDVKHPEREGSWFRSVWATSNASYLNMYLFSYALKDWRYGPHCNWLIFERTSMWTGRQWSFAAGLSFSSWKNMAASDWKWYCAYVLVLLTAL